ncbi:MAG: PHP domain-containing protein [Candidatus Omnitrophica bacterium]|nr:PHP domain-containing protein [Candidatus Omnitrophota bacterium]
MKESEGFCDLHIHSNYSDSDADLESIFKDASQRNLCCIAVTDHDTVKAIPPAKNYSTAFNLELIEAIEISAQHKDCEVHILGYFIDSSYPELLKELEYIRDLRRERLSFMVEKLNELGLELDVELLFSKIGQNIPTRLHLALELIENKKVSSLREAFRKYLSPGRPAYRSRFKHSVKEAIDLIKASGGLSFLAHPHMIADQSWVEEFICLGIDGLEVIYPGMPPVKRSLYSNLASKYNLLKSGGSDAHGSYKAHTNIGQVKIPYSWIVEMKSRLAQAKT